MASFHFEERFYQVGEQIEVQVNVRNAGDTASAGFALEMSVLRSPRSPSLRLTRASFDGLAPGELRAVRLSFPAPSGLPENWHESRVEVRPSGIDVLASNDLARPLSPPFVHPGGFLFGGPFYVSPRIQYARGRYITTITTLPDEGSYTVGLAGVFERADGTIVAMAVGEGARATRTAPARPAVAASAGPRRAPTPAR